MFNTTSTGGDMNTTNNETLAHLTHMMMMNIPSQEQVLISCGVGEVEEYGRVAAWSERETRDLIAIRGELEGDFVVSKRNKGLWEVVGVKMKELGYARSGDQCKCKWKNLVTRYKSIMLLRALGEIRQNTVRSPLVLNPRPSSNEDCGDEVVVLVQRENHCWGPAFALGVRVVVMYSLAVVGKSIFHSCHIVQLVSSRVAASLPPDLAPPEYQDRRYLITYVTALPTLGKETSDRDSTRSFPFFDELHTLFTRTSANTPQTPFDPEATSSQSKSRKRVTRTDSYQSLEEISEDEDEKNITKLPMPPRKKPERDKHPQTSKPPTSGNNSIQEILQNFFQQQQTIDDQWRQLMDKHAYERQLFDQEWRHSMEKLEIERMRMEQSWREKEEQRKIREENRAERRDALLTLLLNKLVHEQ
ncbi:trihelix transcription factor GT-3b-like protein [Tanacetum coccineum]